MNILERSVRATLENLSDHDLVLDEVQVERGTLAPAPPARLAAGKAATWFTAHDGFMQGVAGEVTYRVGDTGGKLVLGWNNPFIGDNEFTQRYVRAIGSGTSERYVPFDPMHPQGATSRPYDARTTVEEALRDDEELEVTYRFAFEDDERDDDNEDDDAPPALPAATTEPRTVTAPGGRRTAVRDSLVGPRQLIYLGLNHWQASTELQSILSAVGQTGSDGIAVRGSTPSPDSDSSWTLRAATKEAPKPGSPPPVLTRQEAEAVRRLLGKKDDIVTPSNPLLAGPCRREWSIVSLANAFAAGTRELERLDKRETPTHQPVRRLVISGHHYAPWTSGRPDVIWGGSHGGESFARVFTLFTSLGELCAIFPRAAAQVEDLMFSACFTGVPEEHANAKCPAIAPHFCKPELFPNLKSLWGYFQVSPSGDTACRHVGLWEKATRDRSDTAVIDAAVTAANKCKWERSAIVWKRQGDTMTAIPPKK